MPWPWTGSVAARSSASTIRATRASSASEESSSRNISTSRGNANGVGRAGRVSTARLRRRRESAAAMRGRFEPALQHFAHRLGQQQILGVVLREDLVEQRRRCLQLPRRIGFARIALEDETGDARDFAELPSAELGGVEPGQHVRLDARCREQPAELAQRERDRGRRQQPEAVVVRREAERARRRARQPVREQRREAEVREPALERVEKERMPFAGRDLLDQPLVGPREPRPACLQFEQRAHELQFGRGEDAVLRVGDELPRRVGELRGQRHLAAGPARDERRLCAGRLHPGGELANADELERASGEDEAIAGGQARDESLLDVAERLAGLQTDGDGRFRHDRADADPMPARDPRVRHAGDAVVADHDAPVLGIRVETRPAVQDEVQCELPLGGSELRVGLRRPDLRPAARPA